jgi:uncharacterized protein (TIGR02646 family)
MRRVHRPALPPPVQRYLDRKARESTSRETIERQWKYARQTKTMGQVLSSLQAMMGARQRCMYCVDSHGSDIEHFWPKAPYPTRAFLWPNLLLCCAECGRLKGNRFPLDSGQPLLIDPSVEDPWASLDFDPDTGNLTARYHLASDSTDPKGDATVRVLQLDQREGMAEGYRRSYRRLVERVQAALAEDVIDRQQLKSELEEADDHGLLGWCFGPVGIRLSPFVELHQRLPDLRTLFELA